MPSTHLLTILTTLDPLSIALPSPPKPLAPTFRCPIRDIIQTKCLGPKDCIYPNPANCASYIKCTVDPGERSGTPHVVRCPLGTRWNDREKTCDFLVGVRTGSIYLSLHYSITVC